MTSEILNDISHRRYNPLRDSWVLVSPHRTKRPWQGQQESPTKTVLPDYDADCYLCPGNKRAQGDINPNYSNTFVFVNDFSAVREEQQEWDGETSKATLFRAEPVKGKCYVLTFSPRHNLTLADMRVDQINSIIDSWTKLYLDHLSPTSPIRVDLPHTLSIPESSTKDKTQYKYMQIFENKGSAMGCSNPHPHGQVWTTTTLPDELALELKHQLSYRNSHADKHLLQDYVLQESEAAHTPSSRTIYSNENFIVLCPWWATWPFESMILPRQHIRALPDLYRHEGMVADLADAIAQLTRRYDNLFETQFPYSMGLHQAPLDATPEEVDASWLHFHFYPPLLRSATVRKFLVGYELMAEPQRDITPEQAAARLRTADGPLYRSIIKKESPP